MKSVACALVFVALLSAPVQAEQTFAWPVNARATADWVSTGIVAGQLTADTIKAFRADDKKSALTCLGMRVGITIGAAELVKHVVHRERPDYSDSMSFYSEHTALLFVSSGWRFSIGIPLAVSGGYLRIAAAKHFPTDVAVGAVAGLLARKVCHDAI